MSFFQPKPKIQLSTEQASTSSSRPLVTKRSSSRWSIPCCSPISFLKQTQVGAIHLPDDLSDSEDEQQQQQGSLQQTLGNYQEQRAPQQDTIFSQNSAHILSRNPFARAPDHQEEQVDNAPKSDAHDAESQTQEGGEELADFSQTSFKYEDEPDWTEAMAYSIKEVSSDTTEQEDTPSTEPVVKKIEEKIPQIEKEVLQHLPLTRLSKEIPPTLIHENQKSMYGEKPFLSSSIEGGSSSSNSSNSHGEESSKNNNRFSMPEEGYQVLKKSKEEHKKSQLSTKLEETNDPLSSVSQEEGRRTSIVSTAAQSLLGEHITDKLAFIKNSIIMNSDDEQEEESNATINNKDSDVEDIPRTLHRRASSILKVGQDIVKMISGVAEEEQEAQDTDHKLSSSVSSTTSSFMTPSSLFSALTGAIPESSFSSSSVSTKKRQEEGLVNNIIQEEDEEDEELFDFTKVIEIGKNVKTFSKGVVGNSIRMFSDVATQIKTSIEEEEIKRRQEALATMKQDDHSADENEWMHNYL